MVKRCGPPSQGWRTFLRNHAPDIAAMDLFVVPTIGFDLLYALVIVRLARREAHLRRILTKYATYYNELRTHRSLNKDAPIRRTIQHVGRIVSAPVLGGLHHHYCRI
jgi:hypothetical protein